MLRIPSSVYLPMTTEKAPHGSTCLVPLFPFSFARTLCWVVERKEGEGLRSASRGTEAAFGGFAGGRGAADRVGVSLREEDGSGRKARPSIRAVLLS
ncbi:hypothetical protein B296_00052979 [Ensete ventricosum]|uniref:Uncharacterized protein n=1 Tax=Ensete ventricosum TaxID=4639 RepID=A0A426XWW8_ENSVE|nr:hypothetical protein B296_00052979 [Ensete ventricosum]